MKKKAQRSHTIGFYVHETVIKGKPTESASKYLCLPRAGGRQTRNRERLLKGNGAAFWAMKMLQSYTVVMAVGFCEITKNQGYTLFFPHGFF